MAFGVRWSFVVACWVFFDEAKKWRWWFWLFHTYTDGYMHEMLPVLDETQTHLHDMRYVDEEIGYDREEKAEKAPPIPFKIRSLHKYDIKTSHTATTATTTVYNRHFVNVFKCAYIYILFIEPNVKQMIYEFNHRYALFLAQASSTHMYRVSTWDKWYDFLPKMIQIQFHFHLLLFVPCVPLMIRFYLIRSKA